MSRRVVAGFCSVAAALSLAAVAGADGAKAPLRVGFVFQSATFERSSDPFQYGAYVGLRESVKKFGVVGKGVAQSPTGSWLPPFSYLARKHYDLIIGLGFLEARDLAVAARRFPKQKFAIVDQRQSSLAGSPKNVEGTWFKTEQAGYLAGYLATLMEMRRPGRHVISSVGGISEPTVNAYIAGYEAGAKKADPKIVTLNGYSNDFLNQAKCERVAQSQIARGSGVVFAVAGSCGLGALEAAKNAHVWGVGVDIDQSNLGSFILTSAVKRLDVAVVRLVGSLVGGTFRTGTDLVFDLRNNGVALGRISSKVPPSFLRVLARVRAEIVAGKIRVPVAIR